MKKKLFIFTNESNYLEDEKNFTDNIDIKSKPRGIKKISVWFFSIKIFSIAGSKSQAIDDVLPATIIEKKAAKKMLIRCLLV